MEEAQAAGLAEGELKHAKDQLEAAESKEKLEASLKTALQERNVHDLKFAIPQAKDAGIDSALIAEAEEVLKVEEPKMKAREQLDEATKHITKAALQEAISAAKAAGLEPTEWAKAEELLKKEEQKEKLMKEVNAALEDSQQVDTKSIESLREMKDKLQTALKAALEAGVAESDLVPIDQRRKKLHNMVEDLKGSIRVFCRVRPLSKKETGQGDSSICEAVDQMTVKVKEEQFLFDAVFTPGTQDEVFEDCRDLVQSAADGYNVTMFAYGQTGAGKTFTMYGTKGNEGTAPRTIQEIFRVTAQGSDRFSYTVSGSMLELYCNNIVDLLSKANPSQSKAKLNIRQEKNGNVSVEGLVEEECSTADELMALLERGNEQRTVAATAMNSESSRSHLVLIIKIISVNKETKEVLKGKMLMCDLAGSERLKKSEVTEHQQTEAIAINKSLTALGDVIEALTKGGKGVVPYRNHKLTMLMQDSLGGTAKTLMFVNCSPASSNLDETFMSLKYAQRAKKITNTATKK
ncbi:Kinesin-like protein KIN-14E (Kinesin-like calmodulin-binding protein) (Protein ZWICHEL) [Durusdinium trenchii]|uniref:Kinesin-like protein n=2 Tax=Durusdinium trenchii TaxID=1381693 RepID=A0ABP0LWB6_9DINO